MRLHLHLDVTATLATVSAFALQCSRPGGDSARRHDLALVAEELLSNLIRHVFTQQPQAQAVCRVQQHEAGSARLYLRAGGPPFNPLLDGVAGYGIALVRSLVSSYSWRYRGGTNRLLVGVRM